MKNSIFTMQGMYAYSQILCSNPQSRDVIGAAMVDGAVSDGDDLSVAEVPTSEDGEKARSVPLKTEPLYVSSLHKTPEELTASKVDPKTNVDTAWFKRAMGSVRDKVEAGINGLFGREGSVATQMMESGGMFAGLGTPDEKADFAKRAALAAGASLAIAGCAAAGGEPSELTSVLTKAIAFNLVGGLGIFMLGLKAMSDGLQSVSGGSFKKILGTLTKHPLIGLALGTGVTAMWQSSSVTTVMTVGLVDAGLINLTQALGVVFGANIGTTITGWLFALKIAKYGLPIVGAGVIPYMFLNKNEKIENIGKALVGIGLVFVGLTTMSEGFKDPLVKEYLTEFFSTMSGEDYISILKCIAAAAIATEVVQSSSATLGVTIALAKAGVIPFETAAALVFGLNIGTTITAVLAALRKGTSLEARRVAASHVMFNLLGVALLFPVSPHYIGAVKKAVESFGVTEVATQTALFHTIFNVLASLVAVSAVKPYEKFIRKILPDRLEKKEVVTTHLSEALLKQPPAVAVEASRGEIVEMGKNVGAMFDDLYRVLSHVGPKPRKGKRIVGMEEKLDQLQTAIFEYLNQLATRQMPLNLSSRVGSQRRMADQYETISDELRDILKRYLALHNNLLEIKGDAKKDLLEVHKEVAGFVEKVNFAVEKNGDNPFSEMRSERKRIIRIIRESRQRHEERVQGGSGESAISTYFMDMLRSYENALERAVNIADELSGGKSQ